MRQLLRKVPFAHQIKRAAFGRGGPPPYAFKRVDDASDLAQIRNLLEYTKTSGSSYSARQYPAGYHSIEINGVRLDGQRDPAKRFELVPVDFAGRTVLDIGSNQGGMLLQLRDKIARGVGVDFDHRMVNAANRIKSSIGAQHLNFYVFDLEKEPLDLLRDFLPGGKVDVVLLLAVCMWLENWREVIDFAASVSESMLFETNGNDAQQTEQEGYLRLKYADVKQLSESSEDDPQQKRRKLFWLTQPRRP
ncbi:MAG TPA: methyltransferase domain-containing protein [Polyangiales bacterium]|nr:methyltransferase domain-containing protein [Polyangiales bacterium]